MNLGDTYVGGASLTGKGAEHGQRIAQPKTKLLAKSLCLIPERFAIEMVNRGWILRNKIIWHKPNPMPSSAKDRFTVDFENVFFFVKSQRYWFDTQYEPADSPPGHKWNLNTPKTFGGDGHIGKNTQNKNRAIWELNPLGRNKRCVWTIPTQACAEAHFATFPEKLVEPMIKAGCPRYVCKACGKARVKIYDVSYEQAGGKGKEKYDTDNQSGGLGSGACTPQSMKYGRANAQHHFKGYTDCGCGKGFRPGVMADIFCGTGTACKVAARLGMDWIGVDLKKEYVANFALPKMQAAETGVPVAEQKAGQLPLWEGGK